MQDDILLEDKATDILSCGAVLYTMLTKRPPSQAQPASSAGHSIADALDAVQEVPLQSLQWPPNCAISPTCKDLLQVMLCTDSASRPTVHEILEHPWYMQDLPREIQVQPQLPALVVASMLPSVRRGLGLLCRPRRSCVKLFLYGRPGEV